LLVGDVEKRGVAGPAFEKTPARNASACGFKRYTSPSAHKRYAVSQGVWGNKFPHKNYRI